MGEGRSRFKGRVEIKEIKGKVKEIKGYRVA